MKRLTVKSSTIVVSVGEKTQFYRSLHEVPPPLRRKLIETTKGANSQTILIADRKGRAEIARAIRGLPGARMTTLPPPARKRPAAPVAPPRAWRWVRRYPSLLVLVLFVAITWWMITSR
jgi:hypothetical protein